ncbi:MAG: 50S ribosomal protein L4 [Candidatus Melainabacteria bacterium]|nr:50S ribosomal protein L4 [Candidatus Melainabacteria bacterium]
MSKTSVQHVEKKTRVEPNVHLLHLSVLRHLNNKRAGTASTKTRAEVRGGGKKPWKQKGTGRARAGSSRSPLWVGGGVTFGPKPRSYKQNLPKKARKIAIAQALALSKEKIEILKGLPEVTDGKTKSFLSLIKSSGLTKRPLLLIADPNEHYFQEALRASRNIPDIKMEDERFISVYEIMKAVSIGITESALKKLEERLPKVT